MNAYRSVRGLILLCNAARRPEAGGHPQCSDLVAVQPNCMRLVVEPGSAHMRSRRVLEQVFLDCIAVEPAIVHSRRAIVARARPAVSVSRPTYSMLTRREANTCSPVLLLCTMQVAECRASVLGGRGRCRQRKPCAGAVIAVDGLHFGNAWTDVSHRRASRGDLKRTTRVPVVSSCHWRMRSCLR